MRDAISDRIPGAATVSPGRGARLTKATAEEVAALFLAEAAGLFRYAHWMTGGDKALTDDIVQEAFQAATMDWERLRNLSQESMRAWLRKVVANKLVDQERRRRRIVLTAETPDLAGGPDPADAVISRDLVRRAENEITLMPPQLRKVIYLRFAEGLTPSEIADLLGASEATVRSHLRHGRKRLRQALEEFWRDEASLGSAWEEPARA